MAPRKRKAQAAGVGNEEDPQVERKSSRKSRKTAPASNSVRITRGMIVDGPRKAVFTTAELLENILLYLPPKTIFGVQRVCRQFRDVVATSAMLQEKMFLRLRPGTARETWAIVRTGSGTGDGYPPADAKLVRLDDPSSGLPNNVQRISNNRPRIYSVRTLNHLLQHDDNHQDILPRLWYHDQETAILDCKGPLDKILNGSLKHTYLTDPPCNEATIAFSWHINASAQMSGRICTRVKGPEGLTLGALMDGALDEDRSGVRAQHYRVRGFGPSQRYGGTPRQMFAHLQEETGKKVYVVVGPVIHLDDAAFPTKAERQTVKDVGE